MLGYYLAIVHVHMIIKSCVYLVFSLLGYMEERARLYSKIISPGVRPDLVCLVINDMLLEIFPTTADPTEMCLKLQDQRNTTFMEESLVIVVKAFENIGKCASYLNKTLSKN